MIVICGVGTLGAHLAEHLARVGGGELTLVDFDRVEGGNLGNQPYFSHQVGQPKVVALAETLFRAGARVKPVQARLEAQNARRHLRGARLVVDALDNHAGRQAVQDACRALRLPCLHLGISRNGYGEVRWDEGYVVPADGAQDPCARPTSRGLALLVTAMAGQALQAFLDGNQRLGYCVTEQDMCVSRLK